MKIQHFFSYLALALLTTQTVFAQADTAEFNIRFFAGVDTEAPTTPVLTSVSPITSTQVDVVWSAATDNFTLAGYVLSRDGLDIATTTLLNYSDSGLLASTTYSYSVRAFDASFNFSSSSNILSTTTPNPPVTATSSAGSSGTASRVVITDLSLDVGYSTTSVALSTSRPSRFELRWGTTESYELGYVVTGAYSREHIINLIELEPGTIYYYEVVGYNERGIDAITRAGTFTTLDYDSIQAPANVNQFTAARNNSDVRLSWKVPASENLDKIRIVRSHLGYPLYPNDGAVIYQGTGNSFNDADILNQYSPVYYTAFVYDKFGNVSSGAIAVVYAQSVSPTETEETPVEIEEVFIEPVAEATSTIDKERVSVSMNMPDQAEIMVVQEGLRTNFLDSNFKIDTHKNMTISIPRGAVSRNLKSIILSIVDPSDSQQAYSYLFKINKDETAYTAVVSPLGIVGESQLVIKIYDFEAFVLGTYQTPVVFSETGIGAVEKPFFPDRAYDYLMCFFKFYIWPLLLLLLAYTYWRRS